MLLVITVPRPRAHLCSWTCRWFCTLGAHHKLDQESKCRCCDHHDHTTQAQRARERNWDELTLKWWEG